MMFVVNIYLPNERYIKPLYSHSQLARTESANLVSRFVSAPTPSL